MLTLMLLACLTHPVGYDYGTASWYGYESAKHPMANGRKFDPRKLTAASYAYPLGTEVEVTNLGNGRKVVVTITDRGPARRLGRLIDLSEASARQLGYHQQGTASVSVFVRKYKGDSNALSASL